MSYQRMWSLVLAMTEANAKGHGQQNAITFRGTTSQQSSRHRPEQPRHPEKRRPRGACFRRGHTGGLLCLDDSDDGRCPARGPPCRHQRTTRIVANTRVLVSNLRVDVRLAHQRPRLFTWASTVDSAASL